MKDAVCGICQKKIQRIEDPILARFYGGLRARLGYRSRGDLSKRKFPVEVGYPNGEKETVNVVAGKFPRFALVPSYDAPPVFSLVVRNRVRQGKFAMEFDKDELLAFMRERKPFANSVATPGVRQILVDGLFLKMAVGLLFDVSPQSLVASGLTESLLAILEPDVDLAALSVDIRQRFGPFSMPQVEVEGHRQAPSKARCFEVCEGGTRYWYAEMRFFPDLFRHRYFVRIPSVTTGPLLSVVFEKNRRQIVTNYICGLGEN